MVMTLKHQALYTTEHIAAYVRIFQMNHISDKNSNTFRQ